MDDDDFDDEEEDVGEPDDSEIVKDQKITGIYIGEDGVVALRLNFVATLQTEDTKENIKTWNYARDIHATLELKLKIVNDDHFSEQVAGIDDHNSRFEIQPIHLEISQLVIRNGMKLD